MAKFSLRMRKFAIYTVSLNNKRCRSDWHNEPFSNFFGSLVVLLNCWATLRAIYTLVAYVYCPLSVALSTECDRRNLLLTLIVRCVYNTCAMTPKSNKNQASLYRVIIVSFIHAVD